MLRRTALVAWLALAALAGTSGAQTPEGALAGTLQKAGFVPCGHILNGSVAHHPGLSHEGHQ